MEKKLGSMATHNLSLTRSFPNATESRFFEALSQIPFPLFIRLQPLINSMISPGVPWIISSLCRIHWVTLKRFKSAYLVHTSFHLCERWQQNGDLHGPQQTASTKKAFPNEYRAISPFLIVVSYNQTHIVMPNNYC